MRNIRPVTISFLLLFSFCFFSCKKDDSTNHASNVKPVITSVEAKEFSSKDGKITLIIKWTVSTEYSFVRVEDESKNTASDVSYPLSSIRISADSGDSVCLKLTPYMDSDNFGSSFIYNYTVNAISSSTIEIDCSGEAGSLKIQKLAPSSVVNLSNAENSKLYLIRTNTSENTLTSNRTFTLESLDSSRSVTVSEDDIFVPVQVPVSDKSLEESLRNNSVPQRINPDIFVDESSIVSPVSTSLNARSVSDETTSYPIDYKIGDTKTVYAGLGEDPNYNIETKATLRYISEKAYVWVVNNEMNGGIDYFTDGEAGGGKVNTALCKKLAETFDKIYELERNIFGNEWEELIGFDNEDNEFYVPMNTNSDTGTKVNLILYDIESDYQEGNSAGTYGYFSWADYFLPGTVYNNTSHSNGGKYLHIDAGFASAYTNYTLSVIVHEFQHIIHYGMKRRNSETWYNEMCSMLAEDMFQKFLSIEDDYSVKRRFKWLITTFNTFPYFKWDTTDMYTHEYSYDNAYGIGCMLAKKFDGPDFVHKLLNDGAGNFDLLLKAVKSYEPDATKESILKDMALEMITGENFKKTIETKKYAMDGYTYPMTGYDIFNCSFTKDGKTYTGPVYSELKSSSNEAVSKTLEPDSLDVAFIGQTKPTASCVSIDFTGDADSDIKEYLVVVKN